MYVWKSEESVLSFRHVRHTSCTQAIRLDNRSLYLLNQFDSPWEAFYVNLIFVDLTVKEGQEKGKDKNYRG